MARRNPKNRRNGGKTNYNNRNKDFRKDKDKELDELKDPKKSGNDPAWYASDPTLLRDAASYPFSYNIGATEIHDAVVWNITNVEDAPASQIAGVCSLHNYPAIGTALTAQDPINVASQAMYSFVRHANSGHTNYDSPDLMMYILSMASMYSFIVYCQRLYGYAMTYNQRNRYLPNELIRTNNVDPKSLVDNLANFRFWLNTLISKVTSFAVPATMSVFSRMTFMYSDFYIEGTSIKDQLYQFVPDGFYKFGLDSASLGNLTFEAFDYTTLMSAQDVMDYGDALFAAIWAQEDFGIMSGDILKAYGDNIIKLVELPEYYKIDPKFDSMVLTQMKNADLVRLDPSRISQSATDAILLQTLVPVGFSTSDVWYGTANAVTAAQATILNTIMTAALKDYRILTVDTDNPTPEVVIEATRLKVGYDPVKSWYKVGTEVVTKVVITTQPGTDIIMEPYIATYDAATADKVGLRKVSELQEAIHNFHYVPRSWIFTFHPDTQKVSIIQNLDIDNFTLLNFKDVMKMHEAATMNMFAVPSVGKVM